MNRIYQGRVVNVETLLPETKNEWAKLENWPNHLWKHHELFQDAVNYYTLMLAALAQGCNNKAFSEKYLADAESRAGETAKPAEREKEIVKARSHAQYQLKALYEWQQRVSETWKTAKRKAVSFDGPHKRIAPVLGLNPEITGFEECVKALSKSCKADRNFRIRAVLTLLAEADRHKSDLNKLCVVKLPFFCSPPGPKYFDATPADVSQTQRSNSGNLILLIHKADPLKLEDVAVKTDPYLFITRPPASDSLNKEDTLDLALKHFDALAKKHGWAKYRGEFKSAVEKKSAKWPLRCLGRKPTGVFPYALVFRYFPNLKIWEALKARTQGDYRRAERAQAEGKVIVEKDYINALRVANNNAQPFEYFTNCTMPKVKDSRAVWFDFDLAAFIEAIMAPHRCFEDTQKRESAAKVIRAEISLIEGEGGPVAAGDAEDKEEKILSGFKNDKRIALIRKLVTDTLSYLAESENPDDKTGGKIEYSISERTLRGFSKIREKWRGLAAKNYPQKQLREKLKEVLVDEQSSHRDDFGSAPLYEKLIEEEFQPIWRDDGTSDFHAKNPLHAWLDYKELERELADKERPIRFTPAHPEHSPRYFDFPKEGAFKTKHLPGISASGAMQFFSWAALKTEKGYKPAQLRVNYCAPRLRRDSLRHDGQEDLTAAKWIQPMMCALGLNEPDTQNFSKTKVTLMPYERGNIQVVFPVEANSEKLQKCVSGGISWKQQFSWCGKNTLGSLRWPHEEKPKTEPEKPWWEMVDSFSCLAVDLGQRDAGAFVRIEASKKKGEKTRFIGKTDKASWYAKIGRQGLLRLPGEDARVWRNGSKNDSEAGFSFREELSGEKGRSADDSEIKEAELLLSDFGCEESEFMPENWRVKLSFPEQNDKLLFAARRAQSRVAQLHRWAWFLGDEKKKELAYSEVKESSDGKLVTEEWKLWAEKKDTRLKAVIYSVLAEKQSKLAPLLVSLANRILPLRGRSWQWLKNPQKQDCFLLAQNGSAMENVKICGQRGISMERIEQISELRKRFQSLNQTLRREIGGKAPARLDDSVPDCCPDLLEKLDRIKEQRVNQTAHMILAEALGLRLAAPGPDKRQLKHTNDLHGSYEKIAEPVSFIVIENLSRYLTSQGRSPRENSRLMKWCHRAVRDKLKMLCEIFYPTLVGKKSVPPILETPAAYSSRFCSRSGVAGFRAMEAAPGFENFTPWCWLKTKKEKDGSPSEIAVKIEEMRKILAGLNADNPQKPRTVLLPIAGGPIFVPITDGETSTGFVPKIVQADINAAINLGLRAISDPRDWSIHPRLRTKRKNKEIIAYEKRKFGADDVVVTEHRTEKEPEDNDDGHNPNFFADFSSSVKWGKASLGAGAPSVPLVSGKALWGTVKSGEWERCMQINRARELKLVRK